jgi:hypothetical protein
MIENAAELVKFYWQSSSHEQTEAKAHPNEVQ